MIYGIYRLLTRLFFALTFPVFLVYAGITDQNWARLRQRFGFYDDICPPTAGTLKIWHLLEGNGGIMVNSCLELTEKIKELFLHPHRIYQGDGCGPFDSPRPTGRR